MTPAQCRRASSTGLRARPWYAATTTSAPAWCAASSRRTTSGPISGWSTRAITAAAQSAGSARSPAASEEPIPVRQSGFGTTVTPGTVTGTAPVTTSTGAVPPSRSRPAPRSTSRRPPSSTSALGVPSRFPSPAASSTPATVLARGGDPPEPPAGSRPRSFVTGPWPRRPLTLRSGSTVDPAGGVGERAAGPAPAKLDQLGGHRDRRLLRGPGAEVQPDRGPEPGQFRLAEPGLTQPGEPILVGPPAAHGPDVAGRGAQCDLEHRHVELGVVGEDADHRALVDRRAGQVAMRPLHDDLVRVGEPGVGCEHRPGIAHGDVVAEELPGPR